MADDCYNIKKLHGFYRGIVLKHLMHGKCKIWIPTVYPDEWRTYENADLLPSAEQASSLAFGANGGNGVFSYPNIGSIVWCFFEMGDQNFPVYFASSLGGEEAFNEWDESLAMVGKHPNDAYVHHVQVKNTHIYAHETGFVKVVTHDGANKNTCTFTMDASGNITLDGTSTITLKAKNIILDGSTQVDIVAPNIKETADIHFAAISPAIDLDSTKGHTAIKSRAPFSPVDPAITVF